MFLRVLLFGINIFDYSLYLRYETKVFGNRKVQSMLIPFKGSDRTRSVVECDDPAGGRYGLHTPSWHAGLIGPARARMILVIGASLLLRIVGGVLGGVIAMRNAPKVRPSSTRGLTYFKVDIIYIIRHKM